MKKNESGKQELRKKNSEFSGTTGFLFSLFIFFFCAAASPTPFDVSKVDVSTINEEEIQKTIAHRNALQEQQKASLTNQAGSLSSASADNQATDRELKGYQKKVDDLAIAAAKDHDKVIAKDAAILRRDIAIGVLSLAIGVYAFLKFYLRVPFL